MTTTALKPLLRIGETAAYLGVCINTMSKWIAAGKIRKIPGTSFIARLEIERFLEQSSKPRKPEQKRRGRYRVGGKK